MDVNVSMAEIYWHQSDDDAGAAPQWVDLFPEGRRWGLPSQVLSEIWHLFFIFHTKKYQKLSEYADIV